MTAKKPEKKTVPRKRAAKKQVGEPNIATVTSLSSDTVQTIDFGPLIPPYEPEHTNLPVRIPAPAPLTWWQRFMNRIDAILDGRVQGTTDPP